MCVRVWTFMLASMCPWMGKLIVTQPQEALVKHAELLRNIIKRNLIHFKVTPLQI